MAASRPSAIGRSKWLPSLRRSAGARLTVIRFGGSARPIAASAARTRSRLSATALSGNPTTENDGKPWVTCTHLDIDVKHVDALERHRIDARHHADGCTPPGLAKA